MRPFFRNAGSGGTNLFESQNRTNMERMSKLYAFPQVEEGHRSGSETGPVAIRSQRESGK